MGEETIFDKIRNWVGMVAWRVFLWSIAMTEERYFNAIYDQERLSRGLGKEKSSTTIKRVIYSCDHSEARKVAYRNGGDGNSIVTIECPKCRKTGTITIPITSSYLAFSDSSLLQSILRFSKDET